MGEGRTNALALESASRRELQCLAKELQLCRGNAKSDVILSHALQFLSDNPSDGEQRVRAALAALTGGARSTTAVTSPVGKTTPSRKTKAANREEVEAKSTSEESSAADQSEGEQSGSVNEGEMAEQHAHEQEKATALSKHSSSAKNKSVVIKKAIFAPPKAGELETPDVAKKPEATPSPPITKPHTSTAPAKTSKVASQASNSSDKATTNPRSALASLENVASKKVSVSAARKDVEALVDSLDDLSFVSESRVRCSATGHEMKADRGTILAYTTGKRYLKARRLKCSFAQYAPMFVAHPDEANSDMLWCNVTESAIARDRKRVEAHIAGPKYQKELPLWRVTEAAKKQAAEEAAQRRADRVEAAKKRRLAVSTKESADITDNERPAKRVAIDRSRG